MLLEVMLYRMAGVNQWEIELFVEDMCWYVLKDHNIEIRLELNQILKINH
jgi:hypothetical protein